VVLGNGGAHGFEALDVQVDGTAADGAAAGHGDAGDASAGDERPRTSELARMVLTISYLATGSERTAQRMLVRCWARP